MQFLLASGGPPDSLTIDAKWYIVRRKHIKRRLMVIIMDWNTGERCLVITGEAFEPVQSEISHLFQPKVGISIDTRIE